MKADYYLDISGPRESISTLWKCLFRSGWKFLAHHLHIIIFYDSCGDVLGHLLPKLAVALFADANSEAKMDVMKKQILDYELLVEQLKV